MSWIPDRYRAFRDAIRRPGVAQDVREEFQAHLEMRTEELVSRGVAPDMARAEALRRFGDITRYDIATRAIDTRTRRRGDRTEFLRALGRETRLALRALARQRAFTMITVLTLGLGLGATLAIFTLLQAIVLRPLPFAASDRIVNITHPVPGVSAGAEWGLSAAGYHHFLKTRLFQSLGVFASDRADVYRNNEAERIQIVASSASLFDVLRVKPALGRLFSVDETRPGATPVALLTHQYWVRAFGSDSNVIRSSIELGSSRLQIIGVLPPNAQLPNVQADLWVPLELDPNAQPMNSHYLAALGRLRDADDTLVVARAMRTEVARFPELYPSAYSPSFMRETGFGIRVVPWHAEVVGPMSRALWIIFGSVALVLVIAATNVVNLVLVRALAGRHEVQLRRALGAQPRHLAWHFVAEGVVVSVAGTLVGLLLAAGGLRLLLVGAPVDIPRLDEVHFGAPTVVAAIVAVLLSTALFAFAPLLQLGGAAGLKAGGARTASGSSRSRHAGRNALVVGQVALSAMLLVSAGLLLRSAMALRRVDSGIHAERTLTFSVWLPPGRYASALEIANFHRDLAQKLTAIPGIESVGAGSSVPLDGGVPCALVFVEGFPVTAGKQPPCVGTPQVAPGYFESLGIAVRGRTRTWSDEDVRSDGVVVSAALARRLWPGRDAIGMGISNRGDAPPYYRVIGVASDVRMQRLEDPPSEVVYFPIRPIDKLPLWNRGRQMTVVLRLNGASPTTFVPKVRAVLQEMDPRVPLAEVGSMEQRLEASTARARFTMSLLAIAAAMALVLSAVGMYGVVWQSVAERRNEIGVRMALGARAAQVRRMVVGESLTLAAIGVFVGLVAAMASARVLRALLYGTAPNDVVTLVSVGLVLLIVAAIASFLPAQRASRIDPSETLRAS